MLQRICPHCGKNVIESYGILNPYLYGIQDEEQHG